MKDVIEIIDDLTCKNQYATEICLLLYLSEKYSSLYYLDYLGIKGEDLETLVNKCCLEYSIDYITQTIRFLRSGFLGMDEIMANLNSKNPIPFIDRLLHEEEDYEIAYENYAGKFRSAFNANNKKR